ncbi:MAG: hypothetical protein P4M14_13105 [Gammaproteobacteria bacterium]|nr:hypothetical protein [Gammaproteobacteria bacterium]
MPLVTIQKDSIRSAIDYYFQFDTKEDLLAEIQNIEQAFLSSLEAKSDFDDLQKLVANPQDFLQRLDEPNPDITVGDVQSYMVEIATEELGKEATKYGVNNLAWHPEAIMQRLREQPNFTESFKAKIHQHNNFENEWTLPPLKNKIYHARLFPEIADEISQYVYAHLTIDASPEPIQDTFQLKRIPYFDISAAENKTIADEVNATAKPDATEEDKKKEINKKRDALLDLKESKFIMATVRLAPAVIEARAEQLILTHLNKMITDEHNRNSNELPEPSFSSIAEEKADSEPLLLGASRISEEAIPDDEDIKIEDAEEVAEEYDGPTLISSQLPAIQLLTNAYYFKEIEAKRLTADTLNALSRETVDFLNLDGTVSLIRTPRIDLSLEDAAQLSTNEKKLTQVFQYHQMLMQDRLTIFDLKEVTDSQYNIVTQQPIMQLIVALKVKFMQAKMLSATGAALLAMPFYQNALQNNQIAFISFTYLSDERLKNLMHPDIIQLFTQQIPSHGALRVISLKSYFGMLRQGKISYATLAGIDDESGNNLKIPGMDILIDQGVMPLEEALLLSQRACIIATNAKMFGLLLAGKVTVAQIANLSEETVHQVEKNPRLILLTKEVIARKIWQWEHPNSNYAAYHNACLFGRRQPAEQKASTQPIPYKPIHPSSRPR